MRARRRRGRGAPAEPWGRLPAPRRGEVLGAHGRSPARAREQDFGEIVQLETGKPWKNAAAEVGSSADLAAFMAGEGSRFYGKTMTSPIDNRGVQTLRQPIGICAGDHAVQQPARRHCLESVSGAALRQRHRRRSRTS